MLSVKIDANVYQQLRSEVDKGNISGFVENNLLKTCSHELAHYIQFVKRGESSCESNWVTEKYIEWLAREHEEFTEWLRFRIREKIKNTHQPQTKLFI